MCILGFLEVVRKLEGRGFKLMRRKAREMALRVLFEVEIAKSDLEKVLQRHVDSCNMQAVTGFAEELVKTVAAHMTKLDEIIEQYAIGWKLDRMGSVDRNLLRLAIAEIVYLDDIPISASINEAIELGKLYGDEQSARFINGILGAVSKAFAKTE
jgi:N utilization substance protein B